MNESMDKLQGALEAALFIYGVFLAAALGLFLFWGAIPIYVIYKIFINL